MGLAWGQRGCAPQSRGNLDVDWLAAIPARVRTGLGAGAKKAREDGPAAQAQILVQVGWGPGDGPGEGEREGAGSRAALGDCGSVPMGVGSSACGCQEGDLGVNGGSSRAGE